LRRLSHPSPKLLHSEFPVLRMLVVLTPKKLSHRSHYGKSIGFRRLVMDTATPSAIPLFSLPYLRGVIFLTSQTFAI
jgi:hypothetical protein